MRILSIDIESYSSVELSDSGVYRYAESPDFEILLIGYKWIDEPNVHVIDLTSKADLTPKELEVINALTDPNVRKCAWNASFERQCFAQWLHRPMPPEQWEDTMVRALELGLPGSLANAGIALGLPAEKLKDPRGKLLINYFSKPCRPTISNGGRTRNLPAHDPEKWKLYIEYNRQDVVTEQAIRDALLQKVPPVQSEWDLWYLDQRINDYGVRVDLVMADKIVRYDDRRRIELQQEAREITGLENPNSLIQLKEWLNKRGYGMETVTKDSLDAALNEVLPADVRRVLEIRQALGKTSVAKYSAMLDAACADGRIRGTLQFYGAARTGRFAGRIVQVHNLPRNSIPDLDLARQLVCSGEFDDLELFYGEPAFVFGELIRTAFIPSPGNQFIVADFSAIEARVLGWLAGEEWVLDAFRAGKDIYCETASKMYHCNVVKHGENGHLRQKGKVATLACIAKGQPVLTDRGLVPIEQVTLGMKVWDGEEWVNHDGVVCRGEREVITYDGLTATPDHPVFIEGEQEPVQFGFAAASGAHLIQTGNGREAIRLCKNHKLGKTLERKLESLLRSDEMPGVRVNPMAELKQPDPRKVEGMSELFSAETDSIMAGSSVNSGKTAVYKPERSGLSPLRRSGDPIRLSECDGSRTVSDPVVRYPGQGDGDRPDQQRRELRTGKSAFCDPERKLRQSTDNRVEPIRPGELAVRGNSCSPDAVLRDEPGRNYRVSGNSGIRTQEELADDKGTAYVYDIRNAGRRHRFTVSGRLVHNCGYGGGIGAMKRMDRSGSIPEEELQSVVDQWRYANNKIVKFWRRCESAARTAIDERRGLGNPVRVNSHILYYYENKNLYALLPNGRSICYWNARLKQDLKTGKESLVFWSVNTARQWAEEETYSGKLVENLTQAVARDCLAEVIKRVSDMGYRIVMHVHDEIIVDAPKSDTGAFKRILEAMKEPIPWAEGLPLNADGYTCDYYRKD